MSTPAVHVAGLEKCYGEVEAVRGIDFHVDRAEVYGLLGPNGAGKSTTLHCMAGLCRRTGGVVEVDGEPAGSMSARRRLGFVPDDLALPGDLTGHEYLQFVQRLRGIDRAERATMLMDACGLGHAIDRPIAEYSHGMKKKVQIVGAVLHDPTVLVLDEPFRGLDPEATYILRHLVTSSLRRGTGVLLATHDLTAAADACDRVGIVADGRIVAEGTPDELMRRHGSDLEEVYLEVSGLADRAARVSRLLDAA